MSNLLERAIIDAKALKEAALKSAEQLVIEKYSEEVKTAMDKIIEQEDPMAAADPMADPAADPFADLQPTGDDPMAVTGDESVEGEETPLDPESIVGGLSDRIRNLATRVPSSRLGPSIKVK